MTAIEPEKTLHCETVFSGKLITVDKVTVQLPGGRTTEREIVKHSPTIAVIPVLDDGRIVFVRQYRKAAERVMLEVPAGGIDDGETPEQAVKREMEEETGYRVGRATPLVSFYTSPGFTTEYMHLFRATDLQAGEPTEQTDQIEVECLTSSEAMQRVQDGDIVDAKSILAVLYQAMSERGEV